MPAAKRHILSFLLVHALLSGCGTGLPEGEWDNPHDPAGTAWHPPVLGLRDTAIRDGETGVVRAFARGQAAEVESCRWILDGGMQETGDCSLPTKGWANGAHAVVVTARDLRGVESPPTTASVWIGNQPPRLVKVDDGRVGASATVEQALRASDPDGSIAEIAWDTVPDRYSILSDLVRLGPLPGGGIRTVHWKARDDEGAVGASSFDLRFVAAPEPEIRMIRSSTGMLIDSKWRYSLNLPVSAVFSFDVLVHPNGDPGDSLAVTASSTQGTYTCSRSPYQSTSLPWRFECTESSGYLWGSAEITATVTNSFGERSSVSVFVNAQRIAS